MAKILAPKKKNKKDKTYVLNALKNLCINNKKNEKEKTIFFFYNKRK